MVAIPLTSVGENNEDDVKNKIARMVRAGRVIRGYKFAPEVKNMGYVACANCKWLVLQPFGGGLCSHTIGGYKAIKDPKNGTKCDGKLWSPRNATQRSVTQELYR